MAHEIVGRYALHGPISSGGMAAVHYGQLVGPIGFARTVAIKRLHAGIAADPDSAAMFLDEARLSARIHHPNVVPTIDVIEHGAELLLVMDYIAGPSLSGLVRMLGRTSEKMPHAHAVAIVLGALHGLHAAHEAKGASGEPLALVHRDVSPQNILVGEDGVPRLIDFGIAKAVERVHLTRGNEIRGKILYMAPEQLSRHEVDRRADIYAASVVLWELLTGRRLVELAAGEDALVAIDIVRNHEPAPAGADPALDAVVMRGLAKDPSRRFQTALEMATALEAALAPSSQRELAAWVQRVAQKLLAERAAALREIESTPQTPSPEIPPALSSRGTFTLAEGHTGKVWAQNPPQKKGFDARPFAAAGVAVAIVVAWVAGTHRGAQTAPPVIVNSPVTPVEVAAPSSSAPPVEIQPAVSVSAKPPPPKPHPVVRPKDKCNPPYTVDAKGIKVPKPECR